MDDYGQAAVKLEKEPTADTFKKLGKIEDFKKEDAKKEDAKKDTKGDVK